MKASFPQVSEGMMAANTSAPRAVRPAGELAEHPVEVPDVADLTPDAPQSAMLLTDQEWSDLAAMVAHYRTCTEWVDNPTQRADYARRIAGREFADDLTVKDRQRALATRIIQAAAP